MTTKNRQEIDAPWKYILNEYFRSFMELCWPVRAKEINWNRKPKFLDKELTKIAKEAAVGNRVVDKLIEVELINGDRCCVLIHLELQLVNILTLISVCSFIGIAYAIFMIRQ